MLFLSHICMNYERTGRRNMIWHMESEIIALTFVLVLIFDMSKNNPLLSRRDHLFKLISIASLSVILIDIAVILFTMNNIGGWIYEVVTILFMLITPFITLVWFFYTCATLYKGAEIKRFILLLGTIPFMLTAGTILSNPIAEVFISRNPPFKNLTEVGFIVIISTCSFYSAITILLCLVRHKHTRRSKAIILCIFPLMVVLSIYLQRILPGYLYIGWACSLSLFITYLFLQNRKMSVDVLTGSQSRASLYKKLKKSECGRGSGCLVVISLDDFKFVNQTFGQGNSDMVLKNVSTYLSTLVRDRLVYRYNGDEFALVLNKQQSLQVREIVSTILTRFNTMWEVNMISFMLSASIAIVEFPQNATTAEQLITSADFAIYEAKRSGKKKAVYFDDKVMRKLRRRHDVESALKKAIDNDGFEVYYQPIYAIEENRFEYAEALLRLNDEYLGSISPCEFIPIAENSGMIVEITYIVFEKVIRFIKQVKSAGLTLGAVAINLSAVNFMQNDISQKIMEIITDNDIDPSEIRLELTEGILVDSFHNVKDVMNRLADQGVLFALDDFGEGYSNISYLINLPFVSVKLDRSIITSHEKNTVLLNSVIPMLKKMGKKVVAEGVETQWQSDALRQLSCDYIQGFLYAKPMTGDDLIKMLSAI